jgi:hypothetical protein
VKGALGMANWKVGRMAWWFSLGAFLVGLTLAYRIHVNGLSTWLGRIDYWHTFGAILIAVLSLGMFALASHGRMKQMRAPGSLLWLIPVFPIWILFE